MVNPPLFVAFGSKNLILTADSETTWTQRYVDAVHPRNLYSYAIDGLGNWIVGGGPSGGGRTDYLLNSNDNMVTWTPVQSTPLTLFNGANPFPPGFSQNVFDIQGVCGTLYHGQGMLFDGTKFTWPGPNTATEYSVFTSSAANGSTWNSPTLANPSFPIPLSGIRDFNYVFISGTTYVGFGDTGLYLSTDGMLSFTLKHALTHPRINSYIAQVGSILLAFGGGTTGMSGDAVICRSTDGGNSWTEIDANNLYLNGNDPSCFLYDSVSGIIAICGFDNGGQGLFYSDDLGLTWHPSNIYDAAFFNPLILSVNGTGHDFAATGQSACFFVSTDAKLWTEVGTQWESPDGLIDNQWIFRQPSGYLTNQIGVGMATSPDGTPGAWTPVYDTSAFNIFRMLGPWAFTPPPPPPAGACVDFEIQSPGDMPDTGAQFTCQRLYITANLDVSGIPQLLTPTLIIEGVEYVLPPITNTGRTTIEIPISQYHGRFFDGVRLDGCLTGRVEIFRIEADVWLGEQQESK